MFKKSLLSLVLIAFLSLNLMACSTTSTEDKKKESSEKLIDDAVAGKEKIATKATEEEKKSMKVIDATKVKADKEVVAITKEPFTYKKDAKTDFQKDLAKLEDGKVSMAKKGEAKKAKKEVVEKVKITKKAEPKKEEVKKDDNALREDEQKVIIASSFEEAVRMAEEARGIVHTEPKKEAVKLSKKKEVSKKKETKKVADKKEVKKLDVKELPKAESISFLATIIYHSNGKNDLSRKDIKSLKAISKFVKEHKETAKVKIIGHASSRTKDMKILKHKLTNYDLSIDRANAVKNKLARLGVDKKKIELVAVSDTEPVKKEIMPVSETMNRRTEVYITY